MPTLETLKKVAEQLTGWARPSDIELLELLRERKANTFHLKDDGIIPNHPHWPLIIYRSPLRFPRGLDPAAVFEDLFKRNGWGHSWRNGIYDYVHYHSRIHEVLGISRGSAKVQFGGKHGRILALKAGDVAILPAGTGHQALSASPDLLVVGAYPPSGTYDVCTSSEDHALAVIAIPNVGKPRKDPVYGHLGSLSALWQSSRNR
jgi:uncharacterized protein YjlB